MDYGTFKSWLDSYGRARETRDVKAAADLFTDDATYQENPFDKPMQGLSAILDYWSNNIQNPQDQIRFSYEILVITQNIGIARWRASFVRIPTKTQVKLDGISVISLNAENRCNAFREWWNKQENIPSKTKEHLNYDFHCYPIKISIIHLEY